MGSTQSTWDSYIHSYTMRVVSIGVMLALGLALALPQYKEQDKGQQGKNLDKEGPHQNNEVKLVPSFDAVKDAAEDELEEDRDNHLEQEPMVDAVKDEDEDKDKDADGCPPRTSQGDCPALSSYGREACLSAVDNRQWFKGELCVWCINDCENKHLCEVRSHAQPLDNYEGCFSVCATVYEEHDYQGSS